MLSPLFYNANGVSFFGLMHQEGKTEVLKVYKNKQLT